MAYCAYTDVQSLTGSALSQAILEAIIDQADRTIDAKLRIAGITGANPADLKAASLEYSIAGLLTRYRMDGTKPASLSVGGLSMSSYSWENTRHNGLTSGAYDFINDLLTVANNIGFDTTKTAGAGSYMWESNSAVKFEFYDHVSGKQVELMQVRAFKNGNLHIKFNQSFMCRLNVEFGRLKGWLKTAKDAVQEMDVTLDVAESCFHSNLKLEINNIPLLSNKIAA